MYYVLRLDTGLGRVHLPEFQENTAITVGMFSSKFLMNNWQLFYYGSVFGHIVMRIDRYKLLVTHHPWQNRRNSKCLYKATYLAQALKRTAVWWYSLRETAFKVRIAMILSNQ